MKENKTGIYCIENKINNKKYIGQSSDIEERWKKHISELNNNNHCNDYLQNAWNKYGQDMFEFYVLEYCCIEELDEKEINYIISYDTLNRDSGYNLKSGGQNGGSKLSIESRKKLSKSIKQSYDDKLKEKRRNDAIKQWSDPEKRKILVENNGMTNKHHSEESKKKMSEHKKGKKSWRRNTTHVFCQELDRIFDDATTAGKELSLDSSSIIKVCKGERKICGGYHWNFIDDNKEKENIIGE